MSLKEIKKYKYSKKEILFCRYIVQGMPTKDAYEKAGYSTETKHWTNNAYALKNRPKIREKIISMQNDFRDMDTLDDYIPNLKKLREIRDNGNDREAVQAIKMLNDMKGYNAPKKVEVENNNNFTLAFNTAQEKPNNIIDITAHQNKGLLEAKLDDDDDEWTDDMDDGEFYAKMEGNG